MQGRLSASAAGGAAVEDGAGGSLAACPQQHSERFRFAEKLGAILVERGRFEEAAANYRLLVGIRPNAVGHQKLAQVLVNLGRTDEARKELKTAKALDRNLGHAR